MQSKGLSRVFSNTTVQKYQFFAAFYIVQLSHPYMTTGKTIALTRRIFVDKVMSLIFNMLSRLVITFLPRSKHLLISWLQSPSAVILGPPKIKSDTDSNVSPSISHEMMGPDLSFLKELTSTFQMKFPGKKKKNHPNGNQDYAEYTKLKGLQTACQGVTTHRPRVTTS